MAQKCIKSLFSYDIHIYLIIHIKIWHNSYVLNLIVSFETFRENTRPSYCEIFGTSSYGEGRTSLRLRHMNECQIFHNINSITFFNIPLKCTIHNASDKHFQNKSNQCFKWPQFTSNQIVSTARQRIHIHAKPLPWHEMENDVNVTSVHSITYNYSASIKIYHF